MSKKAFKSQASASRAFSSNLDGFAQDNHASGFSGVHHSQLSHIYEPPDLTSLSDPQIVVAFKNVQKKDSITKAKALEDLEGYVRSSRDASDGLDESFLEAWIKVYPRTSIDNSRRVRQLAHTLQGQIALSCGKRIARHMPSAVPPWLSGVFDNDKSISRATQDSFKSVFTSQEKYSNIWKIYQSDIVAYSKNVIQNESPNSLSDERTTSPDDANTKYSRTISSVIILITHLLGKIATILKDPGTDANKENYSKSELAKSEDELHELLADSHLWKLAANKDSFIRRSLYRLLLACLSRCQNSLDPTLLSNNILLAGLHTDQNGSSHDFVKAVSQLTDQIPTVWTDHYAGSGKKSAKMRLCSFVRHGSRGSGPLYWSLVAHIVQSVPPTIWVDDPIPTVAAEPVRNSHSLEMLNAMHAGVVRKDEPFLNATAAWKAYLSICRYFSECFPDKKDEVVAEYILPLISQYVRPAPEGNDWTVRGSESLEISTEACKIALQFDENSVIGLWETLSAQLKEDIQTSQPEQASNYARSQDSVARHMSCWYALCSAIVRSSASAGLVLALKRCLSLEIEIALSVLKSRNGKPYGAAATVASLARDLKDVVAEDQAIRGQLESFANSDAPNLVLSPSGKYIISLLDALQSAFDVTSSFSACLTKLETAPVSSQHYDSLLLIFRSPYLYHAAATPEMVKRVTSRALLENEKSDWDLLSAALSNQNTPKDLTDEVLASLTNSLSIDKTDENALDGLTRLQSSNTSMLQEFASSNAGTELLTRLLFLAEATDLPEAKQALTLSKALHGSRQMNGQPSVPSISLIQQQFASASSQSLRVGSLARQARDILDQTPSESRAEILSQLLPEDDQWLRALKPFIDRNPSVSLATCAAYGSLLGMADKSRPIEEGIERDADGESVLVRIVQFVMDLLREDIVSELLSLDQIVTLAVNISLFVEVASDNITVHDSNPVWYSATGDMDDVMAEVITNSQSQVLSWAKGDEGMVASTVLHKLLNASTGRSPAAYYHGRAFARLTSELIEVSDHTTDTFDGERQKALEIADPFKAAALVSSQRLYSDNLRLCNELLSGMLSRRQLISNDDGNLQSIVLLNCVLSREPDVVNDVPQQRLVFFVKHLMSELASSTNEIQTEALKALNVTLPPIKEIYGTFWAEILDYLKVVVKMPSSEHGSPLVAAALQLCVSLQKPSIQSGNEDLLDAWSDGAPEIATGLFDLLIHFKDFPDDSHQPQRIVNTRLSRLFTMLDRSHFPPPTDIFCVINSVSEILQSTAYRMIHERIPDGQEELSLEKGLDQSFVAELPDELLSLIMTPPSVDDIADMPFDRSIPPILRCYLLSWALTFRHWQGASHAVQHDYGKALEDGGHIVGLLNLAMDFLVTSRHKPVNASLFSIETYAIDTDEKPERELHWLLSHLYYLTLLHLPSPAKSWWRDSTSRQTNIAVGSWTQKYISPLLIQSELSAVKAWAATQDTSDDTPLTVKVSHSTKEIAASIPVDERTTSISIRLPPSYPLVRAEVTGVQRVGVAENKWQAWIRNAQGQLTISDGGSNALIDCLLAWRRNVTAAMKGQTECAICYSVVGGDMTLPKKECPTCKNRFHAGCLFRWFKSSNSSSCPLCRNTFAYS